MTVEQRINAKKRPIEREISMIAIRDRKLGKGLFI